MSLSPPPPPPPPAAAPAAVIDTNVVMDWLVFGNPGCAPLVEALESGRLRWVATPAMRGELLHVLGRGVASAYSPDLTKIDEAWRCRACEVAPPPPTLVPRLRCTDADDQKFIDLALHGARFLISRDRAVLKLAKRAAAHGVLILTPERWAALPPA